MSILTENLKRLASNAYGGGNTGDDANVISSAIRAEGALTLAARKQDELLKMSKDELAAKLKKLDFDIEMQAKQFGLEGEKFEEYKNQFAKTLEANQANWEKSFGLQEKTFNATQNNFKTTTQLGLLNQGYALNPTESKNITEQFGLTGTPKLDTYGGSGSGGGSTSTTKNSSIAPFRSSGNQMYPGENAYYKNLNRMLGYA